MTCPKLLFYFIFCSILTGCGGSGTGGSNPSIVKVYKGNMGGSSNTIMAISANGVVVGNAASASTSAFIWNNGAITNIGTLGGVNSTVTAISSDGTTAVGNSNPIGNVITHPFMWKNGALLDLQGLGGTSGTATAVSTDSSVIVGGSHIAGDTAYHAFLWSNNVLTDLHTLGGTNSNAIAVSSDGTVVAGNSNIVTGATHAFVWDAVHGMQDVGTLGGTHSTAITMSANGSTIVGSSLIGGDAYWQAFVWNGAIRNIGTLGGNSSFATGVSMDGNVVSGHSTLAGDTATRAFIWTPATGMVNLGSLSGGFSMATALSADGSTVVGNSLIIGDPAFHAFRWTQATGMQSVDAWLSNNGVTVPVGYSLHRATAVNGDGTIVVGDGTTPNGSTQPWLARVGATGNGLLTNLVDFNTSIVQTSWAIAQNGIALPSLVLFGAHHRTLLDDGLVRTTDGKCAWVTTDIAKSSSELRMLISEAGICKDIGKYRIGIGIGKSWSEHDLELGGYTKTTGQYIITEVDQRLLNLENSVLIYYNTLDANHHRHYLNGATIDSSMGNAVGQSVAARVRSDWKNMISIKKLAISPYVAYTWSQTNVSPYTETGGGFLVNYEANKTQSNNIQAGVVAKVSLTDRSTLRIGVESARNMTRNTIGGTGQVIGAYDFNLPSQNYKHTQVRSMVDYDYRVSKSLVFTFGANAAKLESNPNWGFTVGIRTAF